jgi:tocopherol O-methyltransferase
VTEKVRRFYDLGSPYYLKAYSQHIHDGYYVTGKESRVEAQENLIKLLVEKAGIKTGARVLDVGCGVGGSSIWLAKNLQASTVGITISPVQVELARNLAREQKTDSTFLLMDAEAMNFPETFDVIWAVGVMTHFKDQEKFIKSGARLLNKGGKFVVFDWMPGESVINPRNDRQIKPVAEGMLLNSLHPLSAYLRWFEEYGFRVIYAEDITARTIKTWDDALSVIRDPGTWKLGRNASLAEIVQILGFFRTIRPMKRAMQKGKIRAGAIVAEKIN